MKDKFAPHHPSNTTPSYTPKPPMKRTSLLITIVAAIGLLQAVPDTKAQDFSLSSFEIGEMTSGGNNIGNGSLFFISWGANGVFNSLSPGSSNIVSGDDILFYAGSFLNGASSGALPNVPLTGGLVTGQTFSALFVKDLTSAQIDYMTGAFKNNLIVQSSGVLQYAYGNYRTGNVANVGGNESMTWFIPAAGVALNLYAYSNTGDYTGSSITANLATTSSFSLAVPEPSQWALIVTGIVGLGCVALRRRLASRV
jgi:hypothetical protein